jgi:hypothetical protein
MTKHPLVERYFPEYPQHKLEALAADIKENKQKLPIITFQDKILDGWNRWRAMRLLGWTAGQMKFVAFPGTAEEALAFVFSLNYYRRHQASTDLETMMQLMLAARNTERATSGRPRKDQPPPLTVKDMAEASGVSESTIHRRLRPKRQKFKEPKRLPGDTLSDPFGHEIPPAAMGYWVRQPEVEELVKLAKSLAHKIKSLSKDDPMWSKLSLQALEAKANAIAHDFSESMPYCLCPVCLGRDPENCRLCDGRGLLTEHLYMTGVPQETRETFEATKDL